VSPAAAGVLVVPVSHLIGNPLDVLPDLMKRVLDALRHALSAVRHVVEVADPAVDLGHRIASAACPAQLLAVERRQTGNISEHPGEDASKKHHPVRLFALVGPCELFDYGRCESARMLGELRLRRPGHLDVLIGGNVVTLPYEPLEM